MEVVLYLDSTDDVGVSVDDPDEPFKAPKTELTATKHTSED